MNRGFYWTLLLMSALLAVSCSKYAIVKTNDVSTLLNLPKDTGGTFVAFTQEDFPEAENGFYLYLPKDWEKATVKYPLITYYQGHNAIGDSRVDEKALELMLIDGQPKKIKQGSWKTDIPFIVLMPQARWSDDKKSFYTYSTSKDAFWERLLREYPIDETRLYLTGHSDGGGVVYMLTGTQGRDSIFAAAAPISGNSFDFLPKKGREKMIANMKHTPLWLFHGRGDNFVPLYMSVDVINDLKKIKNGKYESKLTVFPGLGHFCTDAIFDPSISEKYDSAYDPYDQSIYDWFLQYQRIKK